MMVGRGSFPFRVKRPSFKGLLLLGWKPGDVSQHIAWLHIFASSGGTSSENKQAQQVLRFGRQPNINRNIVFWGIMISPNLLVLKVFLLFFLVSFPGSPVQKHARQRIISLNFRGDNNFQRHIWNNQPPPTTRPTDGWKFCKNIPWFLELPGFHHWNRHILLSASRMATKHKPAPQKVVIQTWLKLSKHPAGSGKI